MSETGQPPGRSGRPPPLSNGQLRAGHWPNHSRLSQPAAHRRRLPTGLIRSDVSPTPADLG